MERESRAAFLGTVTLVGCALYVLLDVVVQLLPPHYSPIHQAESDMAVGPYGFLMDINFLIRAALTLCLVGALSTVLPRRARQRAGIIALSVWGVTSGLLAVFSTDILDDRRLVSRPHVTLHGEIHLALAAIGFIAAAIGALLISTDLRSGDLAGSSTAAPLVVAILAVLALLLMPVVGRVHGAGGLGERMFLAAVLAWTAVMAGRARKATAVIVAGRPEGGAVAGV